MTDPVQLVFACVAILEPLINLGTSIHSNVKRASLFGKDAERFRVRYNHERHRLEALRKVLLEKHYGSEKRLTLFEQLKEDWQADLFDELRQLRFLCVEIEIMEVRYGIFSPSHRPLAAAIPTDAMVDLSLEVIENLTCRNLQRKNSLSFGPYATVKGRRICSAAFSSGLIDSEKV